MKAWLVTCLKFTVSGGLVALVFSRLDYRSLAAAANDIDPGMCLVVVAAGALNLVLTTLRWHSLLPRKTRQQGSFRALFNLSMGAMFFNTFVPGGVAGDVFKGHHARRMDLTGPESYGTVVADRVCGLLGLISLGIVGSALAWSGSPFIQHNVWWLVAHAAIPVGAMLTLSGPVTRRVLALPWLSRLGPFRDVYEILANYVRTGRFYKALGLSLSTGTLLIMTMLLIARACGIDISFTSLLWMVPTVGLLSAIPISVSGWGLREAGYVFFFQQIGLVPESALVLSVSFGALQIFLALLGGGWHVVATRFRTHAPTVPAPSLITR